MKLDTMREIANRSTFHRRRAEAMGFRFDNIDVSGFGDWLRLTADFTCVCGTPERFQQAIDEMALMRVQDAEYVLDPARLIDAAGSFSRQHLIDDGFSPEAVDRICKIRAEYRE